MKDVIDAIHVTH